MARRPRPTRPLDMHGEGKRAQELRQCGIRHRCPQVATGTHVPKLGGERTRSGVRSCLWRRRRPSGASWAGTVRQRLPCRPCSFSALAAGSCCSGTLCGGFSTHHSSGPLIFLSLLSAVLLITLVERVPRETSAATSCWCAAPGGTPFLALLCGLPLQVLSQRGA
ncbi:hypothetical protein B0H14DRAFT_2696442, partial [Mycena olivaceomarginata]